MDCAPNDAHPNAPALITRDTMSTPDHAPAGAHAPEPALETTDGAVSGAVKPHDRVDPALGAHDAQGHPEEDRPIDRPLADLGWHQPKDTIYEPLVGQLGNEQLWQLTRRFNKQIVHVKRCERPATILDLNVADDEEFQPDKMRATVERLYMTTIISIIGVAKHLGRIASWNERGRTIAFAAGYAVAFALDMVLPTLFTFIMVLVVYPPSRHFCFPPAPLALVDATTGGIKQPAAGSLGSHDSLTGATETHKGEAVENEASALTASVASIAVSAAIGARAPVDEAEGAEGDLPDPTSLPAQAAGARAEKSGTTEGTEHDRAKEHVDNAVWAKARPVMRAISDVCDGTERLGNALSPTPPFGRAARTRIALILGVAALVSTFVSAKMVVRGAEAGIGFAFFSQPLTQRAIDYLNTRVPDWPKYLELRRTILKGVPTNAQLTLTILRVAEANFAPLPPPPTKTAPPPAAPPAHETADAVEKTAEAMGADPDEVAAAAGPADAEPAPVPEKPKKRSRTAGYFRAVGSGFVNTFLGANRVKAAVGSEHAKRRLGIFPPKGAPEDGPSVFDARYHGQRGVVTVITSAASPCLTFSREAKLGGTTELGHKKVESKPLWAVGLADIVELRKVGGLGWKMELLVGLALGKQIADGLIVRSSDGVEYHLTAIVRRDDLFNRLVALAGTYWEAW